MTFSNLIKQLNDTSNDTKINLKKIILNPSEKTLDGSSIQAISLAVSYSLQHPAIITAAKDFAVDLDEMHTKAASTCANLMAMNNTYYRSLHLLDNQQLLQIPAGLRMQGLIQHNIDKPLFELMALAVSAVNGCGMCLQAHYQQLKSHYSNQQITYALKISALLSSLKQCLVMS